MTSESHPSPGRFTCVPICVLICVRRYLRALAFLCCDETAPWRKCGVFWSVRSGPVPWEESSSHRKRRQRGAGDTIVKGTQAVTYFLQLSMLEFAELSKMVPSAEEHAF